jgi:hypothetical protein
MGGGKGLTAGTALLLSGAAYVAYVLVGFAVFGVGIAYYAEIEDANQSACLYLV